MKYKYIFFDLDGTLTDPKIGITKAVQYALAKNDIVEESLDDLEKFIGPPLKESFMEFYSFDEKEAIQSIDYYREYFKDKGIFENVVYEGIVELLKKLKSRGHILAIATSKPTGFAERIAEHFNLAKYFDCIVGSNFDGTRTNKAEVISDVMDKLKVEDPEDIIMIGDRKHDIIGAKKKHVDSIGVVYGYGSREELEGAQSTYIVDTVSELHDLLVDKSY